MGGEQEQYRGDFKSKSNVLPPTLGDGFMNDYYTIIYILDISLCFSAFTQYFNFQKFKTYLQVNYIYLKDG